MAEQKLWTYDPGLVTASFKDVTLYGYASGTFISVERSERTLTHKVGAQGDVVRARTRNRVGTVKFTLLMESTINQVLSNFLVAAEDGVDPQSDVGVCQVRNLLDQGGKPNARADQAWIEGWPTQGYSSEGETLEWTVVCAKLEVFIGGSST